MLRRSTLLAFAVALLVGCPKKQEKLTTIAVPADGVTLRYDLAAGQEYKGHIKLSNTAQTPVGDVLTKLEFDVVMVVSADEVEGRKLVRATVDAITLDLRLPEGIPAAAAGGLTPEAAAKLNGAEVRFRLDERGDVSDEPEPPANAPLEVQAIVGMVTTALTASFVRVPKDPVKDGATWDATPEKPRPGVKSAKGTGKLEGLARNAAGEEVAQLELVAEFEAERQGVAVTVEQEIAAEFATAGGHPVHVSREITTESKQGTLLSVIDAVWTKGGKRDVAPAKPAGEEQHITDPCDPDYVGEGECKEEAPAQ
jgi:hypothetical protein